MKAKRFKTRLKFLSHVEQSVHLARLGFLQDTFHHQPISALHFQIKGFIAWSLKFTRVSETSEAGQNTAKIDGCQKGPRSLQSKFVRQVASDISSGLFGSSNWYRSNQEMAEPTCKLSSQRLIALTSGQLVKITVRRGTRQDKVGHSLQGLRNRPLASRLVFRFPRTQLSNRQILGRFSTLSDMIEAHGAPT